MGNSRPLAQAADHAATHQELFAAVHLSSMSAVERLRDTLRSEHSFAFQARLWEDSGSSSFSITS